MKCVCGKQTFLSRQQAVNAAFLFGIKFGMSYDTYECRTVAGNWHVTTHRWRKEHADTT